MGFIMTMSDLVECRIFFQRVDFMNLEIFTVIVIVVIYNDFRSK